MNQNTLNKKFRIAVAEDETLIRMDLAEMLTESGYEVVGQGTNGEEAIELANSLNPDLMILDVKMPVLDGISAAEKIIKVCPVLMLTAFSQKE
ncbi:MAG: response regulator, partial [Actinobacteria bacterium]|nr:response regulator [Actinomycetota bacterium]